MSTPSLADLVARATALARPALARPVARRVAAMGAVGIPVLGIAGAPGAGKTTLVERLAAELSSGPDPVVVAHVPMDGFHLADAALDALGVRDRKGAPETFDAWGYAAYLARLAGLRPGETAYAPSFERTLEQPLAGALPVTGTTEIVLTEGNYLLLPQEPWTRARALMTEVWFVEVEDALRRRRLTERHVRFGKSPEAAAAWVARVDEPNAALVATSSGSADLVVRDGGL